MKSRQTRFSDVCGTMDELKRLHHEEHETVTRDPIAVIKPLLEDAMYMLIGMQERIGEYDDYRNRVGAAMQRLEEEIRTVIDPAITAVKFMEDAMESNQRYGATDVADISNAAEAIRSVASSLEHELRARMELALEFNRLFLEIKRDRPWVLDGDDIDSYKGKVELDYQAWLPPEPYRTMLIDLLASSRAEIIDSQHPGGEPIIQFDDGGSIAMSQVRYDSEVENFHPANHKPAPGGRLYRRAIPEDTS